MKRVGYDASFATTITSALTAKAPLANPIFTGTVSGTTKVMIDLGSVDNTSGVHKPVSAATQAATNLKAHAADVANNFEVQTPLLWYYDPANPIATRRISLDLSNIAPEANPTFTATVHGVTKTMINETGEQNKPLSTATQAAINLEATATDITKSSSGFGNVDGACDLSAPVSTATHASMNLKAITTDIAKTFIVFGNAITQAI